MTRCARVFTLAALLTGLVSMSAFGQGSVSISWTGGAPQSLEFVENDQDNILNYGGSEWIWAATLAVTADTTDPMTFDVSGDFAESLWMTGGLVRITANVLNNTSRVWTDFHMDVVNYPDAEFFVVGEVEGAFWGAQQPEGTYYDFLPDSSLHYIQPGDTLTYRMFFWADISDPQDGMLTFVQYPTYEAPEPGSLAALLTGVAGLTAFLKRRSTVR